LVLAQSSNATATFGSLAPVLFLRTLFMMLQTI